MAEQVNQRIEDMINELEQMRRTSLYNDEEIREIARKRKEFEYRIQRRIKCKEDYTSYIAYELALLEDISIRRKVAKLSEKKKDIEYAIAKKINKVFKQMIYRYQNDIEVYFQYIKFCKSVGFDHAISTAIGQMLLMYGDKPKMWQMASKFEHEEQNNLENARNFLLKGIHRHPESEMLYLDLFKIELLLAYKTETDEEKEKQIKRADVVWRNGLKNTSDITYLFKVFDLCTKYDIAQTILAEIKMLLWQKKNEKEVLPFIAEKELEGHHWEEVDDLVDEDCDFPSPLKYYISAYEEALQEHPDEKLCTKYIQGLLSLNDDKYTKQQRVSVVKEAWMFGLDYGLLSSDMYEFGIDLLKLENELTNQEMMEILDKATKKSPATRYLWEQKILLCEQDEKKMLSILQEVKGMAQEDLMKLWNFVVDNIKTGSTIKLLYKRFQNCENVFLMSIKPKLLQKMYDQCGLKAARDLYEEFIRTPPIQIEVHSIMINIEENEEKLNLKQIRKCYECLVQHFGAKNVDVWANYIKFETDKGSAYLAPAIYRRAVTALNKDLVDEFIRIQTLNNVNR